MNIKASILAGLLIISSIAGVSRADEIPWKTLVNRPLKFIVQYPPDWKLIERPDGTTVIYTSAPGGAKVAISQDGPMEPGLVGMAAEGEFGTRLINNKQYSAQKLGDSTVLTVLPYPVEEAIQATYMVPRENNTLLFVFQCSTPAYLKQYTPTFQRLFQTLKIK